jgi:predicted MFS family arabinose efflux permease
LVQQNGTAMRGAQTRIFLIFTVAYFLSYFYRSATAVIAPDLRAEVGLTASQLGLMTSLFFAAFAAVQLPLGVGLDSVGPRWMTPALMLAGVAGSLVFAGAEGFAGLALGRALIGVGMAGVLMGALKVFGQWFSARRYATASGLVVGLGSTGALVAATPLAWLNANYGWRSVFLLGAGAIALVAAAIALGTRNTPPGVAWPGRAQHAGTLRDVFRDRRFQRMAALAFFTNGGLLAVQGLWMGPYLADVFGLGNVAVGNVLFALSLGVTAGYLLSGWLSDRIGLARVNALGAAVFAASLYALALRPPLWAVTAAGALLGLFGGFTIMLLAQPRSLFPPGLTGRAATAVNLFGIGGTFVLQWAMGGVIGAFVADGGGHYPPQAYTTALAALATLTLAALAWYWPLLRETSQGQPQGLPGDQVGNRERRLTSPPGRGA